MKKITLFIICLFFIGITAFSQAIKENGTIYINHPYIDAVNNTVKAYLAKDDATNMKIYADTAKWWVSGMEKSISIKDAIKMWDTDFDYYDSIKITVTGYPDYLHYVDQDAKVVQSWWTWAGKSKKTGQWVKVPYVAFDSFNKDGKIDFEGIYGDWSKMVKN